MNQSLVEKNNINEFALDVLNGFSNEHKYLLAKYFYDERGSELFNQITRHPDYYLTQCELEILNLHKMKLSSLIANEAFNIIELGPGDGIKAKLLIEQFLKDSRDFSYIAIDISQKYLSQIQKKFQELSSLKLKTIHADFFEGLNSVTNQSKQKNLVLFLGSSIGNFNETNAQNFLRQIWNNLNHGDYLLIGFDLKKDIQVLIKAYSDTDGITKEFNLNLLSRINRELNCNFNLSFFEHFATYNVYKGAMESYLISSKKQKIYIGACNRCFIFQEYEPIHVEYSYKFLLSQVKEYAKKAGFEISHNFFDEKGYFLNSLWRVVKKPS
jgi:dimethylhistidine N-methyltransferase